MCYTKQNSSSIGYKPAEYLQVWGGKQFPYEKNLKLFATRVDSDPILNLNHILSRR